MPFVWAPKKNPITFPRCDLREATARGVEVAGGTEDWEEGSDAGFT